MSYKCDKCKYCFKSNYLLEKHMRRKISCDTIFKCNKCGIIFNHKKSLDYHINKKTPCVSDENVLKIQLELKNLELKEKILIDKDKERQHEKDMIEIKSKASLSKNLQIADQRFNYEKEILEIKKQNTLEIERVKTERKEKTVTHINEVHIQNNIQNTINNNIKLEQKFIQNINHIYGKNPNIIPLDVAAETLINSIIGDPKLTMELFHGFESRDDLLKICLNRMYKIQSNKPIAYNGALETYYNISNDSNIGELNIEKTELTNIQPNIKRNLTEILITLYGVSGISGCKTQVKIDNAFDERLKKIDNTRKSIENIDIHPASSEVFSC